MVFNAVVLMACAALSSAPLVSASAVPAVSVNNADYYSSAAGNAAFSSGSTTAAGSVGPAPIISATPSVSRRVATSSQDVATCKTSAECKVLDKNGVCTADGTCQCKDGYNWDTDRCVKTTKEFCNGYCKTQDPHAVCGDVAKLLCECNHAGWRINKAGDACETYPKAQCDADCKKQGGAGWACDPTDYAMCVQTQ